ncbi:hypothetical protein FAIPA1_70203 [Frankia sp. AiPs1]
MPVAAMAPRATLVVTSHGGTILAIAGSMLCLAVPDWYGLDRVPNAGTLVLNEPAIGHQRPDGNPSFLRYSGRIPMSIL